MVALSTELARLARIADDLNDGFLPAISTTYTGLNIVASGIYPVGDWRKKVHASYMDESVPAGLFKGSFATISAAINAGVQVGDWYYDSTGFTFRELTGIGPGTSVRIFRAGSPELPSLIGVAATTTRVIIFDLTKNVPEMWMEFVAASNNILFELTALSDVTFAGSQLCVSGSTSGAFVIDFADDHAVTHRQSGGGTVHGRYLGTIAQRNDALTHDGSSDIGFIVNNAVNAVATYLSGSGATNDAGVEIPTVIVGTDGGLSQIDPDGTVYDLTRTSGTKDVTSVGFTDDGNLLFAAEENTAQTRFAFHRAGLATADEDAASYSALTNVTRFREAGISEEALPNVTLTTAADGMLVAGTNTDNEFVISSTELLVPYILNESTPLESLAAYIRSTDTTGWMKGDVQGAWMGDTDTASLGGELVTNGDFATDTDWTKGTGWTISGGVASASAVGSAGGDQLFQTTATYQAGRAFVVTYTISNYTSGELRFLLYNSDGDRHDGAVRAANGTFTEIAVVALTATGTFNRLSFQGNAGGGGDFTGDIDNVSVTEAVFDHSGNGNHLIVNGTPTRAAVATGAELAEVSGFSVSNYLESAAGMDGIGTGDFCFYGWLPGTANSTSNQVVLSRSSGTTDIALFKIESDDGTNPNEWRYQLGTDEVFSGTTETGLIFYVLQRNAGTATLHINGIEVISFANSEDITDAAGTVRYGLGQGGGNPWENGMALARFSNTPLTQADIDRIYRDELELFQGNAACTLSGGSNAVTALAYDTRRNRTHAATSAGTSVFAGLNRVDTLTGDDAVSAHDDASIGNAAGDTQIDKPAVPLRDLLAQLRG